MAGLEVFGWLTFALATSLLFRSEAAIAAAKDILNYYPYRLFALLLLTVAIGLFFNSPPEADVVFALGTQRYMILLFGLSIAMISFFPTLKGYKVFLIFVTVSAVYAIFQFFTGIDLMRPGSNRAVQGLPFSVAGIEVWRSAGFFGSPMGYAYIAGQHAFLPLAFYFLSKDQPSLRKLRQHSAIAFTVISLSIVTTFVRNAWLALVITPVVIAFLVRPKLAAKTAGITTAAVVALATFSESVRIRLLTAFDINYSSNTDRMQIWQINWEIFKEFPIFGIGVHQNEVFARDYAAKLGMVDPFIGHAHSNYLQMLSGTGLVGLTLYLAIIGWMLYLSWKLYDKLPVNLIWERSIALAAIGAQVYLHIGGLTECNFKAGATNHNLMIVWALIIALCCKHRNLLEERNA